MHAEDLDQAVLLDCMSFSLPWPPSAYLNELNNTGGKVWVAERAQERLEYKSPFPVPVAFVQPADARAVITVIVVWVIVDQTHIATLAVHRDAGRGSQTLCVALRGSRRGCYALRVVGSAQGTKPPRTFTGNSILK
jgi:ribosomal-protein-alanine N-acetyltransferase